MTRHALRWLGTLLAALFLALPAHADFKLAVVDFQRALNEVDEGVTAMAKLQGIREEKMKRIEQMRQNILAMQQEYEKQASLLSEAARSEKQAQIGKAQMEFQQLAASSEQELQTTYMGMMDDIIGKMREVTEQIAREKGYDLVIEKTEGGVVYTAEQVDDITDELIRRYNKLHPIKNASQSSSSGG